MRSGFSKKSAAHKQAVRLIKAQCVRVTTSNEHTLTPTMGDFSVEVLALRDVPWRRTTTAAMIVLPLCGLARSPFGLLDVSQLLTHHAGALTLSPVPKTAPLRCLVIEAPEGYAYSATRNAALRPMDDAFRRIIYRACQRLQTNERPDQFARLLFDRASAPFSSPPRRPSPAVEKAREIMHAYERRLAPAELACLTGVTAKYLTNAFKRSLGLPMYQYQLRVRLARALLELSEMKGITALAHTHGFSSHSHFTHVFRTVYGFTPSAYRNAL